MQTEDPEIQCPYNQSHLILKSRMQAHIVKCKKNYPLADKMVCPFNAIHHVDKPDYQYHVSTCPDRRVIEGHKYETADTQHGDIDCSPYQQPELPPSEENWDAEAPVEAYNPSEHVESAPVVRMLQGATKSQRKAFRLKERQRIQRLLEGESPSPPSSSSDGNDLAPLRLPRQQPEALRLLDPSMGLGRGGGNRISQECNPGNMAGFEQGTSVTDALPIPIGIGRGRPLMQ